MFIAVLFTITKLWKQPKCPSIDEWIKQLWDIYTMEYYLAVKKNKNLTLFNSVDGSGEHYTKWNKPVRERQIPHEHPYVESNEQTELTRKTETDSQMENSWQLFGVCVGGG